MDAGEPAEKRPSMEDTRRSSSIAAPLNRFNDPSTADVVLSITGNPAVKIYVHSAIVCRRSGYFAALLSDRWRKKHSAVIPGKPMNVTVSPTSGSTDSYVSVLRLMYVDDIRREIDRASLAIVILPVAQELLFEDCVSACVRFLEAVPWTDEEEHRVMDLIPYLNGDESRELLGRVSLLPERGETVDNLLYEMVVWAVDDQRRDRKQGMCVKLSVAEVLRDFSTRESAGRALDRAFERTLDVIEWKLFYRDVAFDKARAFGIDLLWLVETMVELRVADNVVKRWSELSFSEKYWRKYDSSMTSLSFNDILLNCSHRLANAVAAGTVLAPRQIRIKLVKDWVRLLTSCRERYSNMGRMKQYSITGRRYKKVCREFEAAILRILSTLPMLEEKESLQHCLTCKPQPNHYMVAFNTWFHRATQALR